MQSHIRKVYACLAVTCHLHFCQNDQDLLHATAVTQGWNRYRNKSQHKKLTLEKKISRCSCRDSNPQPFSHKSGALITELSLPWLSVLILSFSCCDTLFLLPVYYLWLFCDLFLYIQSSAYPLCFLLDFTHTCIKLDLLHNWLIMLWRPAHTHAHTHTRTHTSDTLKCITDRNRSEWLAFFGST